MTKRVKIIVLFAILVVLLLIVLPWSQKSDPGAPRYVPAQSQPGGPFGEEGDAWGDPIPFRDGKAWIFTSVNRTNHHVYLYDLENRKVLGEMLNGGVAFANKDYTKFLCEDGASQSSSLKNRIVARLNSIFPRKMRIPTNRVEAQWIFDLKNNAARRVGELEQIPGTGSTWRPAPGFRFGFNVPNNSEEGTSFFLCDLETDSFRKIKFKGQLYNWWDDHEILVSDHDGNYLLFDVLTGKTVTLFSVDALTKYCRDFNLPTNSLHPLSCWNGSTFDYYFSDARHWGDWKGSFLLKVDKTVPSLQMFSPAFEFHWSGRIHENGKYYLYCGESGKPGRGGNGAVYMRDLVNKTNITLVPPDSSGQYALARFYSNSVIYSRNRTLWRINLDGSNNARLFIPPVAGP